ncbi:DUF1684 domain-containing protein [Bifidobacterium vespertilionis]|uniref:DUF1684 domain-containing protein n=1 Tax=Bifidobacterium vespertilionis TaxID=2562524 RepID=UPI001BDBE558|nr:DUF1684 domain-containing protein [Bifidobacterium vespertilionis]MBT1179812.1 DUF1684 domain-containing protein [Bifidobacterium vespertilionis]
MSTALTYQDVVNQTDQEYAADWRAWHEAREAELDSEYGWLSLRSIDWLTDGQTITIPKFPGTWTQHGDTVTYTPEAGKPVTNRGQVITEPKDIEVTARADVNVEDFDYEGVRAQLIKRIGASRQFAVRQRDPNSATRRSFHGVPHFPLDRSWVLPAHYEPLAEWKNSETGAVLGDLSHNETIIGYLTFEKDGKEYKLTVFQGHNDDSGWTKVDPETGKIVYLDNRQNTDGHGFVLFRDQTSGKETYGGARDFGIDVSDPSAITYIDFNRTANLPCAFTLYCTCPFAPAENFLPFEVRAGETTPTIVHEDDLIDSAESAEDDALAA